MPKHPVRYFATNGEAFKARHTYTSEVAQRWFAANAPHGWDGARIGQYSVDYVYGPGGRAAMPTDMVVGAAYADIAPLLTPEEADRCVASYKARDTSGHDRWMLGRFTILAAAMLVCDRLKAHPKAAAVRAAAQEELDAWNAAAERAGLPPFTFQG